jgi:hypothetical protein
MPTMTAKLAGQARAAGYEVVRVEQPRSNRWVLTLRDDSGALALLMVQQRPLLSAADVQDLAELLECARASRGMLLALDGAFSPEARRTAVELRHRPIQLCTALPPTARATDKEAASLMRGGVQIP